MNKTKNAVADNPQAIQPAEQSSTVENIENPIDNELSNFELINSNPETERKFDWSKKKLQTAYLLSLGKYTSAEISRSVGIDAKTITNWKRYPQFTKKINEFVYQTGYSDKAERVKGQKSILQKIETVLLNKLSNDVEVKFIKTTPLLAKYYEGIKTLQRETDGLTGNKNAKQIKTINLIEIINLIPDEGKKQTIKDFLKTTIINAIKERRTPQAIDAEPISNASKQNAVTIPAEVIPEPIQPATNGTPNAEPEPAELLNDFDIE